MSKYRQWILITELSETMDWTSPNIEALEQTLVCTVINKSNIGDNYGTIHLKFSSPLTESAIRKRMPHGIASLQPIDGRTTTTEHSDGDQPVKKRKRSVQDASTQTDIPKHNDIIEKIKAMKARIAKLEGENQELRDKNDINYIASFLD